MTILTDYINDLEFVINRDCGTGNAANITAVAEYLCKQYNALGFKAELVDFGENVGKAVLARNKPNADRYDVLFNAHLDTVFPDGTVEKRPLRIEGDIAYGPGVSDCKGGVLAILHAMKNARREDLERLSIAILHNPDEEIGSPSSARWLCEHAKKAKRVIVCEPARDKGELLKARKGYANFRVVFHGKAAHAGNNPQDGRNANIAMMKFGLESYKLHQPEIGITVNPGVVGCATKLSNVVSDMAYIDYDVRFLEDAQGDQVKEKFQELCSRDWGKDIQVEFTVVKEKPAMPYNDRSKELVDTMTRAAQMAGFEAKWVLAGGYSDGNIMAKMGVPVVDGCGPAGGQLHSDREYSRLNTVERHVKMLARLLELI